MPRAPKKCPTFGCENRVVGSGRRCPECVARRPLSPSAKAAKLAVERRRRAEAVRGWVKVNGWVCPGWQRPAHPSRDLTAAHTQAVARGGTDSLLVVLCRSCNSRQGVTPSP